MKMRTKAVILIAAALLLTTVIALPRIIEAKRLNGSNAIKSLAVQPVLAASIAQNQKSGNVTVGASVRNDTSPPLRDMKPARGGKKFEREANENPKIPSAVNHKDEADPVVQGPNSVLAFAGLNMPSPLLNFDGIAFPGVSCNCAPPDTNGEVGATQYVQIVNEGYQVFDKTTGASVLGPSAITTVWSGFGGVCQNNGSGDPVVLYDQIANRWVITQFAGVSVPTDECIAVSTTSDATGSYNRYDFHLGSNFFDYPHLSVWPDAFYMSMNVFNASGTAFLGPQAFAFDRAKMLSGLPATFVAGPLGGGSEDVYLPADLDGSVLPPAGAPATFVEFPGTGVYKVFHFHVDFATPANSSFTLFSSPAAAGFSVLCATTRSCVPQNGTTNRLDGIGDRLMFRLAYRNFGDHESVVGNYTVSSGGVAGIRWFELRGVSSGPVTKFQESTYQPDTTWRWMGSAAMDQQGNLALGYSASSSAIKPQIRYAGRLATDPVNTLTQAESTLFSGAGSQTGTLNRWGDYSDLTVDPVDDCTFWYTQEYIPSNGSNNWRTRIGAFKFPGCGGSPTPTPTPTPPTPTPTPTPPPPTQLLANPGFESGNVIWVATAGVITNSTGRTPRTGSWYAWLDGYGTSHTDSLYQQVTIPASVTTATLTFYLKIDTAETTNTIAYDTLKVQIRNSSNTVLATLATYSNLNKGTVYVLKTFDVSAYKGQTIRVYFLGVEDSSLQTSFLIDDTALNTN